MLSGFVNVGIDIVLCGVTTPTAEDDTVHLMFVNPIEEIVILV